MRYARARRDVTHAPIVAGLRALGVSIVETHAVGGGVPDAVWGYGGRMGWFEFKRPGWRKVGGARQRATFVAQERFRAGWRGYPVDTVETLDEAIAAIPGLRAA